MALNWYAVKTVYRVSTLGRARNSDKGYDHASTLVEERIVLFRARSFDSATRKADLEARRYVRGKRRNVYDQRIVIRYLGEADAFELFDPPANGREVYSRTDLVDRTVSDRDVVKAALGPRDRKGDEDRRRKFIDGALARKLWPNA